MKNLRKIIFIVFIFIAFNATSQDLVSSSDALVKLEEKFSAMEKEFIAKDISKLDFDISKDYIYRVRDFLVRDIDVAESLNLGLIETLEVFANFQEEVILISDDIKRLLSQN